MTKNNKLLMNPIIAIMLCLIIFTLSVGGRECGRSKKTKAGSSTTWAGISAPSNVNAVGSSPLRIIISWTDNSFNEDGFYIERKIETDGVYTRVGTAGANISSFSDTPNLCPGNTYYYRVMAYMTTGDVSNYSAETSVLLSRPISSLTSGIGYFYTTLDSNLPAWGWGANDVYEITLGIGSTDTVALPVRMGTESDWATIAGGLTHQIGLKTNGILWSWGFNGLGELGLGDQDSRDYPIMIESDFDWNLFENIAEVSCGIYTSMARKTDGTLWAWGYNEYGQSGIGDYEDYTAANQIGADSDWISISAGYYHMLGRKSNNSIWSWGLNDLGQLGIGNDLIGTRNTPTRIGSDADWSVIAGGFEQSLAIKTNGSMWAWGWNSVGQLGLGYISFIENAPVRVGTGFDWSMVSTGLLYTLARKTNNTLWSCGWNGDGALGLGDTDSRNSFSQIGTDSDWDKFTASYDSSVASKLDGSIWAWGWNGGLLGLGDTIIRYSPDRVRLGIPAAPSSLTATVISESRIDLYWTDNSADELAFRIERKIGLSGTYNEVGMSGASINYYADTSADPSCTYYYRVRAHSVFGNGPYSGEISATSLQYPPPAPTVLTATPITSTRIDCAWEDVSGEMGYRIERSTPNTNTYSEIALINADITSYADTSVDPVITYYYRIKAYNSIGESDYSPEDQAITPSGPPNIPSSFNAMVITATQVNLAWSDIGGEDGYKIERKNGLNGAYNQIATTAADTVSFSDTAVTPVNTYYYKIRAYNAQGNGGYTAERSVVTPDVPPNPPSILTADAVTSTRINLSWDDTSTNELGYRIERSFNGVSYSEIGISSRNNITYTDTTVDPETTYYYRVRSYNSIGTSDYSISATDTTPAGPPNAPTILETAAVSPTQINLLWSAVTGVTGYKIERKTGASGTYSQIGTQNAGTVTYSDMTTIASTKYYYRIRAYNANGDSPYYSPEANAMWSQGAWIALTAASQQTKALRSNRTLWNWGDNNNGQLGFPGYNVSTPTQVGTGSDWITTTAGKAWHSIALKTNGTIWGWGSNAYGELGIGYSGDSTIDPIQITTAIDWSQIAAGFLQTYGIRNNGTLWSWGYNESGELGIGNTNNSYSPTQIGNGTNWKSVFNTLRHGIAIQNDTSLWTWGCNDKGQLGLGDTIRRLTPNQVTGTGWLSAIGGGDSQVDINFAYTLAIKTNGSLWSWGWNASGQLGIANTIDQYTPTQVGISTDWSKIAAGFNHSIACKRDIIKSCG